MRSIQSKITAITIAAILTIILAVFGVVSVTIRAESDRRSVEMMDLLRQDTVTSLEKYFESIEQSVEMAANIAADNLDSVTLVESGAIVAPERERVQTPEQLAQLDAYLAEHCERVQDAFASVASHTHGVVSYYYFLNPEISAAGQGFFYSKMGKTGFDAREASTAVRLDPEDLEHDSWYYLSKQRGRPAWVGPYQASYSGGKWVYSYLVPIYKAGSLVSVLGMDIPLDTLTAQVSAIRVYDSGMLEQLEDVRYIINHLDQALDEGWVQVWYQPIVRAANGQICDEEALSRWVDPVKGTLSPGAFVPILEKARLIYKLDLYVLDRILEKAKAQQEAGLPLVPQSLNLSREDFDSCDIVEEIRRRVDAAGLPHEMLTIEITESAVGSSFDFMKEQVRRFHELGFPVWMDDFGSGYSALDVLQDIRFDLLKFDMHFMERFSESDESKIILTELVRMAVGLGIETMCEGVETKEQADFLLEIGCTKLQGYYFSRPVPFSEIASRFNKGVGRSFEDPRESAYYEAVGRVNVYDMTVIADADSDALHRFFDTLPLSVVELRDGKLRYIRSNQSYRDFVKRSFGLELAEVTAFSDPHTISPALMKQLHHCAEEGGRMFFDDALPDGSTAHAFVRRVGSNPVSGCTAVAIVVLSVSEAQEGATYAGIARALAADYYNIYYVDLKTERFIEYSSPIGGEELAIERHGENFFEASREAVMTRIYEEDRDSFLDVFSKESIVRTLDEQGTFSATYRKIDTSAPLYVNMKITRMQPDGEHIIIGISIVDAQMKQKENEERQRKERIVFERLTALAGNFIAIYSVDPETEHYTQFSVSQDFSDFGLALEGEGFFDQVQKDAPLAVHPEDLEEYLQQVKRESVMGQIKRNGLFALKYRLVLGGKVVPVSLRAALVKEGDGEKLIVGVNAVEETHLKGSRE